MSQNEKDELISDIKSELEEIEHSTMHMGTHQSVSPTTGITHASDHKVGKLQEENICFYHL